MRISIFVVLVVGGLACTKHNPNVCCTDAADCMANGIPVGSTCADGLLCRGNQCVAETCTAASECDNSAPYCVMGACGPSCTDDTQCPGNGQASDDQFCVSGACVPCRVGMNDCPANAPVCQMNACRGCAVDSECASNVCDVDSGACVGESSIRYAAPTGADSADCSMSAPCTVNKAISLVDVQHPWVRMLPGAYTFAAPASITAKAFALVATGASWPGIRIPVSTGSTLKVRGLESAGYACDSTSTPSSISLTDVTSSSSCSFGSCDVTISRSTFQAGLAFNSSPNFTIDRALVMNAIVTGLQSGQGMQARITNSLIFDGFNVGFATPAAGNLIKIEVAHNTFYSRQVAEAATCSYGVPASSVLYTNNIFYAPLTSTQRGAFFADATYNGCTLDTNIEYPQATAVGNPVIVLDPMFADSANDDFHLMAHSVAIDAAKLIPNEPTVDYDGTPRPQGAGYDIGAFEYH